MKNKLSLSIAILLSTFFPSHLFAANLLIDGAQQNQPNNQAQQPLEVYDYTLKHHPNVSNKVTDLDNLDENNILIDLEAIALAANSNRDKNALAVNLLALVLKHKSKEGYAKYLFAASGLLKDKVAQQKAHEYSYHLVQTYPNHCMLGVLAFLHQSPDYDVHTIVVDESQAICTNCHLIAMQFFNKKLPASKQGCHRQPFPKLAPTLACACFHSSRFTQQQRQLSALIDHFSKSKPKRKGTSSNAIHRKDEILIPANGQCLYNTLLLGYLLPAITNQQAYTRRYQQLTGKNYISIPAKMLAAYAADINTLHANPQCQQLLNDFMTHMHLEKGKWGGKEEIQKIANYLHIHIQEYVPNPENPTARVHSDLTRPRDTTTAPATITIHIVRDNPLSKEAAHHPASVKTAYHQQHYRLLYPLSKLPKYNQPWHATSEEEDDSKDDKKEEAIQPEAPAIGSIPQPSLTQPVAKPIALYQDPTKRLQKLSQNQKVNILKHFLHYPNRILWEGWIKMSQPQQQVIARYAIVTDDDLCYIFSHRPSLHNPQSLQPQHTINLTQYHFVGSVQKEKNTFILSAINPYVTKSNLNNTYIFSYSGTAQGQVYKAQNSNLLLQDEFDNYLMLCGINQKERNQFQQWIKKHEIDEESIIQDMSDGEGSNLKEHNLAIYQAVQQCISQQPKAILANADKFESRPAYSPTAFFATLRYATHQYYYLAPIDIHNFHIAQQATAGRWQNTLLVYLSLASHTLDKQTMRKLSNALTAAKGYKISNTIRAFIGTHTLQPLQKDTPIEEENYHLVQITCQTRNDTQRQAHMYGLFPKTYTTTYQQLAELLQDYLHTDVYTLTHYNENTDLSGNEGIIYWQNKDRAFTLTLAPTMQPIDTHTYAADQEATDQANQASYTCPYLLKTENTDYLAQQCPIYRRMQKADPFAISNKGIQPSAYDPAKTYFTDEDWQHLQTKAHGETPPCLRKEACPAFQQLIKSKPTTKAHQCHLALFSHPIRRRNLTSSQEESPFSYEGNFSKMHSIDLRTLHPLEQLQDEKILLKALVLEIIKNDVQNSKGQQGNKPTLNNNITIADIQRLQYITANELRWIEKVQQKAVGTPLNIAEMFALKLYTDWTDCCYDLGKAQRNGNFAKWPIWDQLLMRAILKLHHHELAKGQKTKAPLYSGLHNIHLSKTRIGFFKTYTSTTPAINIAAHFMNEKGMLVHLKQAMSQQFINCDVSRISCFNEAEILFARSADVGFYSAPKWQAEITNYIDQGKTQQNVTFSPALPELILRAGVQKELPPAPFYKFSYIKLEKNARLTIAPWQPYNKEGGYLRIHCFGECILDENATIDVSKKGYAGGDRQHPQGYGAGGGYGNRYCAAGGSHITQGGAAQCLDAFKKAAYHAQAGKTYGKPMHTPKDLVLGSGGGCIGYTSQEVLTGSPGGGALYLEVSDNLTLHKKAQLLANGGDAHALSGGAGSGGSICIQVKGKLILPTSNAIHFTAQGGNNQLACHPMAQGQGGHGHITLHVNQLYIMQHESIITYWCRQYNIRDTKTIIKHLPTITTFVLHSNNLPTAVAAPQTAIHNEIPHHVIVAAHYYNAKGKDYRKKAQYSEALAFHKKALQLQAKKYDNQAIHPAMADTYGHKGATLAAQGNYAEAITAHKEELRIAQACYQKTNAAHPKLLQAHTHLSIAYHGQGQDTEAMQYLNKAIQLSTNAQNNKEIADVYDTRGLLHRSQGNYNQAIQDHQKAADIRKHLYSQKAHPDSVTSYKRIGQAYHAQGKSRAAIASYQHGLKMWQKLYPNQPNHPDGASIHLLLGDVYHSLGQYKQAIAYQEKALASYKKNYPKQNHPHIADTLLRLGKSYDKQGDYDLATYYYQQALQMLRALYKQKDTLDGLFSYLLQKGISKTNVQQCQQWLEKNNFDDEALLEDLQNNQAASNIAAYDPKIYLLLKKWLQEQAPTTLDEPCHPAIADALAQQGNAYLHFGNVTKALQNHQKAYTIRKFTYSNPAHPNRIASCNNIARLHLHQKQYRQAFQILNKAINVWQEQYGTQAHPIISLTYRLRGLVYHNQANYALARQDHRMSLSINKKLYGENPHPAIADDHYAMADTYAKEGKYKDNVLPHYKKALEIRQQIYSNIPYHPAITAALSAIGTIYAAIGESSQAIEYHAQSTRCQLQHFRKANQIDHTLSLYVPTNASRVKALEEEVFPLHSRVKQFIDHTDNAMLLLHGDAGAGKSLYGRFLENDLWSTYQENNKSIIPLFISLPALKDPIHHAVTETLTQYGWDNATIQALQQQSYHHYNQRTQAPEDDSKDDEKTDTLSTTTRLLIFLDGYDEINATQNLYQTNQLAQWGAKVIIGCRTEYLDQLDNYRQYFQADAELYIRPFNAQQIDAYLDHIEATKQVHAMQKTTWHKAQYKAKFEKMPSLKALSTSPFLLQLIVTALPHLPNRTEITRADIYHTFIAQWITNAVNRMAQQGMENISKAACWQYGMEMAFFMLLHARVTIQNPAGNPNPVKEAGLCNHFSDAENNCHYTGAPFFAAANALLRKALPLKQLSKTTSSFLHKSIQEYCAAQALLQSVAQLSPRSPNELTTYFAKKVKTYNPINNKNTPALNKKLLNAAPAIIQFLVDELAPTAQYPVWKEWLFAIIAASKKNSQVAIAAANSATILNAGNISLACKDWAGICIPHALLDHAFLPHTNLQGANLMGVSLRQAYLEDAQCQKANLQGMRFGEYPTIPHSAIVRSVSWSPDGTRLASGSDDNNVRIWDVATGNQLKLCAGHANRVSSVSWSHDGTRLASASFDNSVRIWDVATGNLLQQCDGHTNRVSSVSWSPDGQRLASASRDKSVRIWDVATGNPLQQCDGHTSTVSSVSWSPEGQRLASASGGYGGDNSVRIWDVATGRQLQQCAGHTSTVYSVSWSPDGKQLASASYDTSVCIWDGASGKQLQQCAHTGFVYSVSWSPDATRLASASSDKSVRIWDGATGKLLQQCAGHANFVYSVSWSPDGQHLASASSDKNVRIWDAATSNPLQQGAGHTSYVSSVCWSPDGTRLASASADKSVRIWDVATGKQLQQCTGHTYWVRSVSWSPDGRHLASASYNKNVHIWDAASGKLLQQYAGHTHWVKSVSWSPDGKRLASASEDKSVRIWDVNTSKLLLQCTGHTGYVHSVSWSPDGKHLASASKDKSVRIWDAATGKQVQQCTGHTHWIYSVSWSPDGKRLASASLDKSVRTWDVATGKPLQRCVGHTDTVWSVSWSPDGNCLASASEDKSVRIWDGASGKQLQQCAGHTHWVYSVSWSPDGTRLASASADKSVRIWDMATGKLLQQTGGVKKGKVVRIISKAIPLTLTDANFTDAIELSEAYKQLVQQRGGIA